MMFGKKQNLNEQQNKIIIPVLVGPTSSGKTSLALGYCKEFGASIVSADSRQVYKYMDIGTGKTPIDSNIKVIKGDGCWEFDGTKVYGYDLTEPDEYFSAYDFAKYGLAKIRQVLLGNEKVIIVGGTGFYIGLLTGRQILNSTAPDFDLRSQLESQSLTDLLDTLAQQDKKTYESIDKKNKARVIRAVEKTLSVQHNTPLELLEDVEFKFYGLTADRTVLYTRADTWVDKIFDNGFLGEVRFLMEKYPNTPKLQGLVYNTAVNLINGKISEQDAKQRIKWDIHAYIRRQQTWFKRNPKTKWLNIAEISKKDIINLLVC